MKIFSEMSDEVLDTNYKHFCRALKEAFELLLDENVCGEKAQYGAVNEEVVFRNASKYWNALVEARAERVRRGTASQSIEADFGPVM